jgi:excinuclease ABC subunit B
MREAPPPQLEEAARLRDEVKRLRATELAVVDDPTAKQRQGGGRLCRHENTRVREFAEEGLEARRQQRRAWLAHRVPLLLLPGRAEIGQRVVTARKSTNPSRRNAGPDPALPSGPLPERPTMPARRQQIFQPTTRANLPEFGPPPLRRRRGIGVDGRSGSVLRR